MLALLAGAAIAQSEIVISDALVIPPVGQSGRSAVHTDAIEAMLVAGTFTAPVSGTKVRLPNGQDREWKSLKANKDGWFEDAALRGGYAFATYNNDAPKVVLLKAAGHGMVYVNGIPRGGDVYGYGYLSLPIEFAAGMQSLLFTVGRGRLRIALAPPPAEQYIDTADATLPDYVVGERAPVDAGIVVGNATTTSASGLVMKATIGSETRTTYLPALVPLSVRKVRCILPAPDSKETGSVECKLVLTRENSNEVVHQANINLRVRGKFETRKRTFVSEIDGSVQYYAVRPASEDGALKALALSLHGASVEALGQVDAYSSKDWCHIVAPTNRRPFGFDWEDWGRIDALEVLEIAKKSLRTADDRVYLTGHSMGGHGTWQLAAHYPGLFAAIGPSAGWVSFWSYTGAPTYANPTAIESVLMRASSASDTLQLKRNYLHEAIYILHGDADDNVPVTEARAMAKELGAFHKDWQIFEQPGAGHWWENSDEPGAECMDWPAMYDLFQKRRLPTNLVRRVEFATVNPGLSSTCDWLTIEQQTESMKLSSAEFSVDPLARRFVGKTTNVQRVSIDVSKLTAGDVSFEIDGAKLGALHVPDGKRFSFERQANGWTVVGPLDPKMKGPHRYGPFKDAFRHRMAFVYGTSGTPEENAWSFNKARFDAESFYYRGNGSVDLVADKEAGRIDKDRSVIIYGNAACNSAWASLLSDSPIRVSRTSVSVGGKKYDGTGLACLFIRPRSTSAVSSVGVIAGTGMPGLRLTERMPMFLAGVAYPDWIVFDTATLATGTGGIRAAGFFGNDWKVE